MKKRVTRWDGFCWHGRLVDMEQYEKMLRGIIKGDCDEVRDERDPLWNDDFYHEEVRVNVRTGRTVLIVRNG